MTHTEAVVMLWWLVYVCHKQSSLFSDGPPAMSMATRAWWQFLPVVFRRVHTLVKGETVRSLILKVKLEVLEESQQEERS